MDRRKFIETTAKGSAMMLAATSGLAGLACSSPVQETVPISQVKKPLAIAMWDFSWILRHHRYGSFENWEEVVAGLAERGYNAIRMDAMPQFVVSEKDGTIIEQFRSPVKTWTPAMWGNSFSMNFQPRQALLEFLPLCKKYGIKVGLATWFLPHGIERDIFTEEGGLLRAWIETLDFLKAHNLLDNVVYVDLLNEYPNNHGYDWLKMELNKCSDTQTYLLNNLNAHLPQDIKTDVQAQELRKIVYNNFSKVLCGTLSKKYPELDFFVSYDSGLDDLDLTNQKALDYHIWFHHRGGLPALDEILSLNLEQDWGKLSKNLNLYWAENKSNLIEWIASLIARVASVAAKNGVPCGNTEGWGAIGWMDHPDLNWDFIKESAEICVGLCKKHPQYKFICTSNFTHPHFTGIWDDVEWHREITRKIRSV